MALVPKVVFTYHAIDRQLERFYNLSKVAIRNALLQPDKWIRYQDDDLNADNRGDGRKIKITMDVDGTKVVAIAILKIEDGERVMVVPTVHKL